MPRSIPSAEVPGALAYDRRFTGSSPSSSSAASSSASCCPPRESSSPAVRSCFVGRRGGAASGRITA